MKKSLLCILTVLLVFLFPVINANAGYTIRQTDVTRIVTLEHGVTLRSSPANLGDDNKITIIHANTYLDVYGMVEIWYYVEYNGQYGFVTSGSDWTRVVERGGPRETTQAQPATQSYLGNTQPSQSNASTGWYCPKCGIALNAEDNFCPKDGTPRPNLANQTVNTNQVYDIGKPDLHGQSYGLNQMNLAVFWVQVQLKATGIYYQEEIWDETGNLGDHTMQEVAAFMQSRGYRGHTGRVDQTVIDELVLYLGDRVVPVYAGGFYSHMDTIMTGGHTGSMQQIVSNMRDNVAHVTIGARWVQCCLKKLGFYKGSIDGMYGEGTEKAVKAFQKAYGFEQRDYVSLGVARAMLEACHNMGFDLNDLP